MVSYVLPYAVIEIREYLAADKTSPYSRWFNRLNAQAAAKLTTALTRMAQGNLGNAKSVGAGVQECRIEFGPGYGIYFGRDGDRLVILLRREQKAPTRRHPGGPSIVVGLSAPQAKGAVTCL